MPPKRKAATTSFSGLIGSDNEDSLPVTTATTTANTAGAHDTNERPAKKTRGRPRSKSAEGAKPAMPSKRESTAARAQAQAQAQAQEPEPAATAAPTRRNTRRGRPKGSRNSAQIVAEQEQEQEQDQQQHAEEHAGDEGAGGVGGEEAVEAEGPAEETAADAMSVDELEEEPVAKPTRAAQPAPKAGGRGRKKTGSTGAGRTSTGAGTKQITDDGEFEYTPTSVKQTKAPPKRKEEPEKPKRTRKGTEKGAEKEAEKAVPAVPEEDENAAPEYVEETMVQEEQVDARPVSVSPSKRRQSYLQSSPLKRKLGYGEDKTGGEPELRRRIGDLTKKCDALENRYRTLKEIGVVEANANNEKLRKQCEAISNSSNNLVASLKSELDAQKSLGQKSRSLQQQLKQRDADMAKYKTQCDEARAQAEEATAKLSSSQSEVKALQTKLAAARNTAATLENAKVPGSAVKGGVNRANAAEAKEAAQFAQLKEDLYSDLTGLIIRDVKQREKDSLYDCIQTGVNGTLHFKLAVPHVSSGDFETAEFQYIPLLDASRDRDLVDILPEYLTVDITFVRQQASKFYTRVIDALTKRRTSIQ